MAVGKTEAVYDYDQMRGLFNNALNTTADRGTREELFALHQELTNKALEVMKAKNHDYASKGDPYRNFRTFGLLGVLVRLSDKLARLRSFTENGVTKVADETIQDTLVDVINYAVIFEGMLRDGVTQ